MLKIPFSPFFDVEQSDYFIPFFLKDPVYSLSTTVFLSDTFKQMHSFKCICLDDEIAFKCICLDDEIA